MKAIFVEKRFEAEGVKTFVFKPEKKFVFEAGQFAFLNFKLSGKNFSKHFTMSNSPLREKVEFTTVLSGSDYKNALDSLEPGHEVEIAGPMGEFTLKKAVKKKIVFLCGGIGVTTARSILVFLADSKQDRNITLFYSNRNEKRIAFRQELADLQKQISGLRVVHALAELAEDEKKNWRGETGFIGRAMIEKNCGYWNEAVFFVVGPPGFVAAMAKMLSIEMKIPNKMVVVENFYGY